MATSQNGWSVYTSAPSGTCRWITGRVRDGDVETVLNYLAERFDAEVEKIRKDWSWGYAYRAVRGRTSGYSNHASGTAVDFNAPAHVLGKVNTFSSRQEAAIRRILNDLDGVVRWGGDYSGRKDEMHFEINKGSAAVATVARKIRGGTVVRPVQDAWEWDPKVKSHLHLVQREFQKGAGVIKGEALNRYHGVAAIQNALNVKAGANLKRDGFAGERTTDAMAAYERKHKVGTGRGSTPDEESLGEKGLQILYRFKVKAATATKPKPKPTPPKPRPKVGVVTGTWNIRGGQHAADHINQMLVRETDRDEHHALLLQECTAMYGRFKVPGYTVYQAKPKSEGHVSENGSNAILVRDDVAVEDYGLLEMTKPWRGPKLGIMHDPRVLPFVDLNIGGKDVSLLDVHTPVGKGTAAAVDEVNRAIVKWLKSGGPRIADGDHNQRYLTVLGKVARPAGATVDGAWPDMAVFKGLKKVKGENRGRLGSDHDFKTRVYEA